MRTVYVVKSEEVLQGTAHQVFLNIKNRGFFAERVVMENRKDFQQIIPSFIIIDNEKESILVYQRKPKHTEQRLAGMWTPVFGGHIDPIDWDRVATKHPVTVNNFSNIPAVVYNGLVREMEEETGMLLDSSKIKFHGFVKDNKNDVGLVHLGVLFAVETPITEELKKQILSKTEINDIMEISFKDLNEFINDKDYILEGWATLVINDLLSNTEV